MTSRDMPTMDNRMSHVSEGNHSLPGKSVCPDMWTVIAGLFHVGYWSLLALYLVHINRLVPLGGDGWFHTLKAAHPGPVRRYINSYLWENPRIGEFFSLLGYKEEWLGILINTGTVLLFIFLMFLFAYLRAPSWRSIGDFFRLSLILALLWLFLPEVGVMFFFRPWGANYLLGFSLLMAFLVPYLLQWQWRKARWWSIPLMLACGFVAGLTNEHTVPPVILILGGWLLYEWRVGKNSLDPWKWSGLIGLTAGYAALYFAPGQMKRYKGEGQQLFENLGEKLSDIPRLLGHLWELSGYAGIALAIILLISILQLARNQERSGKELATSLVISGLYLAAAHLMITLLAVSPRQGDKLFLASVALMLASLLMLGDYWLKKRSVLLAGMGMLSVAVNLYFAHQVHGQYHFYQKEFQKRVAKIERQKAMGKQVIRIRRYKTRRSRLIWGDDTGRIKVGIPAMAEYFGVEKITYYQRRPRKEKK